jgi:membrane-associated phospholipid phosphatase
MSPRIANFISSIGSPVVLFPVVSSYLAVKEFGFERARPAIIAVFSVFIALSLFILIRKMRGKISNLDVSEQKQRARNVYLPALGLLVVVSVFFYFQKMPFLRHSISVGLMLGTCFAINTWKKISLHTTIATYLSGLVFTSDPWLGTGLFLFSALIAWSRVVLGRHTREEVLLGWVVGSGFGLLTMTVDFDF